MLASTIYAPHREQVGVIYELPIDELPIAGTVGSRPNLFRARFHSGWRMV
jgi:hypothetical protein